MNTYPFLFWAYSLFWAGIAAYVALLGVRMGRMKKRLDGIERRAGGRDNA